MPDVVLQTVELLLPIQFFPPSQGKTIEPIVVAQIA